MSVEACALVWDTKLPNLADKLVLLKLADFCKPGSFECWTTIPVLMQQTGLSKSEIHRGLNRLSVLGLISRKSGGGRGKTNKYYLNLNGAQQTLFMKETVSIGDRLNQETVSIGDKNGAQQTPKRVLEEEEKRTRARPSPPKKEDVSDPEWLAKLTTDPTYRGLDVEKSIRKCRNWCSVNRKTFSRKRIINWLNREERPLKINPESKSCI